MFTRLQHPLRCFKPVGSEEFTELYDVDGSCGLDYEPPLLIDLGSVRKVTLGSSSAGTSDANSQYYWA